MKKYTYKRTHRAIALLLVVVLLIGGITVAAVSVGKMNNGRIQASEKSSEVAACITKGRLDTVADVDYELYKLQHKGEAPESILKFAYENDLSTDLWPQYMIELLERNPETEEFVINYPLLKDKEFEIDLSDSNYQTEVPLFLQWDERWGYSPYGSSNIAIAGCGPTCLSMVYTYLTGDTSMNPKAMAEFSTDYGYCVPGNGTQWALIHEGGEILGLDVEEVWLDEYAIAEELEEGNPVICIMDKGIFTTGGHFIVLTDYIDGKFKVNDPNSIIRSEQLWSYDEIQDQILGIWACSK